jgi:hypothetical protein
MVAEDSIASEQPEKANGASPGGAVSAMHY